MVQLLFELHETSLRILHYGNSFPSTFPEVLLAHAIVDDWPTVAKHANTDELERQYKCDAHDNYVRIFYFTCWIHYGYSLQDLRGTNRTDGSTLSLRRLPGPGPRRGGAGRVWLWTLRGPVLRDRCDMVRSLFGVRPTAASVEGDDSMSISEREDWEGSEPDQTDSSGPSDLQEELIRVLSKAVQELELTWSPSEDSVRSKLDSWYFRSTQKVDSRASVPFFPDVHEQLMKTWSMPQSACVHTTTQATFSHVDGAEAHGYVRSPPVEETVAAHLCPAAAKTLGSDISLPSKPCRTTAHLANKAFASDGEAAIIRSSRRRRRAELSLQRLWRICTRRRTSCWWRRSERPRPWVRPRVLWSSFRGTFG